MPVVVTDDDVLAEIAKTDAQAKGIDAAIATLTTVPPATLAEWKAFLAGYQAWSKTSTEDLSGGFLGGAWFGVPELGDQVLAYETQLNAWQTQINTLAGRQIAPVGTLPTTIADQNAALPGLPVSWAPSTGTQVIIGAAIVLLLVLALAPERAMIRSRVAA